MFSAGACLSAAQVTSNLSPTLRPLSHSCRQCLHPRLCSCPCKLITDLFNLTLHMGASPAMGKMQHRCSLGQLLGNLCKLVLNSMAPQSAYFSKGNFYISTPMDFNFTSCVWLALFEQKINPNVDTEHLIVLVLERPALRENSQEGYKSWKNFTLSYLR